MVALLEIAEQLQEVMVTIDIPIKAFMYNV
jgi:hypothetical protein